jgi:hypothetical protein
MQIARVHGGIGGSSHCPQNRIGWAQGARRPPRPAEMTTARRSTGSRSCWRNARRSPRRSPARRARLMTKASRRTTTWRSSRFRHSPVQILERLSRNGRWQITSYLVPTAAEHEDDTEAIADLIEQKILVLRHEPVAEALVRFAVPRVLTGNFTPSVEALEVFKRRRAASRFAVACH